MTLLVLFRTRLEWCNYTCHYCPWNANEVRVEADSFRQDEERLTRVIDRVAELSRPVEFFITPKAEYMVLPYWREAVRRLLALPQVRRVTVQTNLAWDVAGFLESTSSPRRAGSVSDRGEPPQTCKLRPLTLPARPPAADAPGSPGEQGEPGASAAGGDKLALWTTFHPTEVDAAGLEDLHAKWALLRSAGVRFSVGVVGTRDNLDAMDDLRRRLPPDVYLWVNAFKREGGGYYTPADRQRIRAVDPLFDLNDRLYPSLGKPCTAGSHAVYLDDEGDLRRCFFVGGVIGNLFRDGWATLPAPSPCPVETCHCYVGHMHVVELDFRAVYGDGLAARIPLGWAKPETPRPRIG